MVIDKNIMSRCFKHYDVKQLRHRGCVPATHKLLEVYGLRPSIKIKDN